MQPEPEIRHAAACLGAVGECAGIPQSQYIFAVSQSHAQQGGYPHPENCTGTAQTESRRHAQNVSRAHRGGKSSGKGLELGKGSAALAGLGTQAAERPPQNGFPAPELEEPQPETQV